MNRKRAVFNFLFLTVVFSATIYYVFHGEDLGQLAEYIQMSDIRYWIIAAVFMLAYIIGESVILFYLMRSMKQDVVFGHCCLYSFIGFFFCCITPSASGGQPMQLYYMKKDGLSVVVSTYILMIVTIGYKMVLVLLGLAVIIVRPSKIVGYLDSVYGWIILGIVLNVIVVGFILLLLFHVGLAGAILKGMLNLGCRIRLIKNREKWECQIESMLERYTQVSDYLKRNPRIGLNVLLLSIVQRIALFAVTAVVYLSFGLRGESLAVIIVLQGMISVAVDMLPTPGGLGITEGLFLSIFAPIFGEFTLPGMVVSRGIGFYTQLIICFFMTIIAHIVIVGRHMTKKRTSEEMK